MKNARRTNNIRAIFVHIIALVFPFRHRSRLKEEKAIDTDAANKAKRLVNMPIFQKWIRNLIQENMFHVFRRSSFTHYITGLSVIHLYHTTVSIHYHN